LTPTLFNPYRFASAGNTYTSTADTDCILSNGTNGNWVVFTPAQKYASGTWSNIASSPATQTKNLAGGGNFTDGVVMGGATANGEAYATKLFYHWNGSTWNNSPPPDFSTDTWQNVGGGASQDAWWASGNYALTPNMQTFDGTSWSANNPLTHAMRAGCGNGHSSSAFCVGGYAGGLYNQQWNQQFDGTSWSDDTEFPLTDSSGSGGSPTSADSYSASGLQAGAGTGDTCLINQRDDIASGLYSWNGSAWSQGNNSVYHHVMCQVAGDSTTAMKAGGEYLPTGLAVNTCEVLTGGTWATTGILTTVSFGGGMGGNSIS